MQPLAPRPSLTQAGPQRGSQQSIKAAPYPSKATKKMEPIPVTASPHAVAKLLPHIEEFEMEGGEVATGKEKTKAKAKAKAKPELKPHQRVGMAKLTPLAVAAKAPAVIKAQKVKPAKTAAEKEKKEKEKEKEKKEKADALFHERVWNKLVKMLEVARQKSICLSFIPYELFKDKPFYTEHPEWASLAKGKGNWMVTLIKDAGYTVQRRKVAGSDFTAYDISGWAAPEAK